VRDEPGAALRGRTRTLGGVVPGGVALGGVGLWGVALAGVARAGVVLAGIVLAGVVLAGVAPLSGRPAMLVPRGVLVPRVVLLLVVMTTPEESVHRMDLDNLRWKMRQLVERRKCSSRL
jgi:hypothetical protein